MAKRTFSHNARTLHTLADTALGSPSLYTLIIIIRGAQEYSTQKRKFVCFFWLIFFGNTITITLHRLDLSPIIFLML